MASRAVRSAWRGEKLAGNMWQWLSIIIISAGDYIKSNYRANPVGGMIEPGIDREVGVGAISLDVTGDYMPEARLVID